MDSLVSGLASAKMKPLEEESKVLKEFMKHNAFSEAQARNCYSLPLSSKKWFEPAVKRLAQKGTLVEAARDYYYISQQEQEAQAKWKRNRWFIIPGAIVAAVIITLLIYGL